MNRCEKEANDMNLKEAFQAQNKIGELMAYIVRYLSNTDDVTTITEKHLRSKALAGQQDEDVDASRRSEEGFDVGKLLTTWQKLMTERDAIGIAIGKAKATMDFNLGSISFLVGLSHKGIMVQ